MSDRIYTIDYKKLIQWLTPQILRQSKFIAWMNVLVKPVNFLYQSLLNYRKAKLYQLMITPQKCYLERLLNDRYDYSLRRIYINDGLDKPPFYIFMDSELKPQWLYRHSEAKPDWIFTGGESGTITDDFIVYVPSDITFEQPEMISLVKAYKLAGTKFRIQLF